MSPTLIRLTLSTQLAATAFMTGIAWFVQLVHYPLFADVGQASFPLYQRKNIRKTAGLVAPIMAVEAAACVSLLRFQRTPAAAIGAALLLMIWALSAGVQLPQHMSLAPAFDKTLHERLIRLHWLRALAWTARLGLAVWMAA